MLDLKLRGILTSSFGLMRALQRMTKPRDIRFFEEKPRSFVNLKLRYSEIPEVKTSDIASFWFKIRLKPWMIDILTSGTFFNAHICCKNHCALLYLQVSEG